MSTKNYRIVVVKSEPGNKPVTSVTEYNYDEALDAWKKMCEEIPEIFLRPQLEWIGQCDAYLEEHIDGLTEIIFSIELFKSKKVYR